MSYKLVVLLVLGSIMLGGCGAKQGRNLELEAAIDQAEKAVGMPNPAAVNCDDKGGRVVAAVRGDGGQYGVCLFADNRQCEEWALFREECPVGGVAVAGYETAEQIYCVITGGRVAVEDGECELPNKGRCALTDYYSGGCSSVSADFSHMIRVAQPVSEQKVTSPLLIKGEARGGWYFEASFPFRLLDGQGQEIAVGFAEAQTDWMTDDFVPFTAILNFNQPTGSIGELLLLRNNPSGLSVYDAVVSVPVRF